MTTKKNKSINAQKRDFNRYIETSQNYYKAILKTLDIVGLVEQTGNVSGDIAMEMRYLSTYGKLTGCRI